MRTDSKPLIIFLALVCVFDLWTTYQLREDFTKSQRVRCLAGVQRDRAFTAWVGALQAEDSHYAAQIVTTNPSEAKHLIRRDRVFITLLAARSSIAKTICPTENND
jgi:hypothetical protein